MYNDVLDSLCDDEIRDIEKKVNSKLGEYKKNNRIIKDDIFKILEMNAKVIYYPIENDDVCGFVYTYKNRKFIYINSYIPLEKQIFTASHELYHIWYSKSTKGELLKRVILEENIPTDEIKNEDLIANRFGAEFLLPKDVFINELEIRKLTRFKLSLRDIVELMDVFLVPYKTIVRRLYEVEYLSKDQCIEFLHEEDRCEDSKVILWQKRLNICKRNNERTKEVKLSNIVDMALELYELKKITYDKLEYILGLAKLNPLDFNIKQDNLYLPTEEELLKLMEEE